MGKHWKIYHGGKKTNFKVEVIGYYASALERQVSEGVRISRTGASKILNSKSVYSRNRLPRIVTVDVPEVETLDDTEKQMEILYWLIS